MAGQRERERTEKEELVERQRGIEDRVEKRFGRNAATPIRGKDSRKREGRKRELGASRVHIIQFHELARVSTVEY